MKSDEIEDYVKHFFFKQANVTLVHINFDR